MAKAKKSEFPAWAPIEAIEYLIEHRELAKHYDKRDPRRACPDMLHRLLTHDDMRRVWERLRLSPKRYAVLIFAAAAGSGFCGPRGEARLTPKQHKEHFAKVRQLSAELSEILRGTDLDYQLVVRSDLINNDVGRLYWSRFSEILDNVDSVARHFATASAGKRTHGEHARRAYFVRYLTGFFREYLGGPRRELVAIATAAAFDNPRSFTARQVIRLAP